MKKKIIIGAVALVLIVAVVFAVIFGVNSYKRKIMTDYAGVVSVYFEAAKTGNNQLMDIAYTYESFSGGFDYEDAAETVSEPIGKYKGLSYEVDKAYEAVLNLKIKNEEMQKIKDVVLVHYEQYKVFEDNMLNHTQENYNADYGKTYKSWQIPFANEHHKLRNLLAKYR